MERPFPSYQGDEPYIFVSYSHEDSEIVYAEIQWLKDQGFNIWYDEGISPGHEWHEELGERIAESSLFLYFITPQSVASEHCVREVNYAIDQKTQLLVVHLEPAELSHGLGMSLSSLQAIIRHELSDLDYRIKLLKGTSDHIQRGMAQTQHLPSTGVSIRTRTIVVTSLLTLLVGILVTAIGMKESQPVGVTTVAPLIHLTIDPLDEVPLASVQSLAISSDGQRVLFAGQGGAGSKILLRHLNNLSIQSIRGTETPPGAGGISNIALSPNGEWVVYYSPFDLTLKRVPLVGGPPNTLVKMGLNGLAGATWWQNDTIVYAPLTSRGLMQVSAQGGQATELTTPEEGLFHSSPSFIPGHDALLFTITDDRRFGLGQIAIHFPATGTTRVLTRGQNARFAASGHLLFMRDNAIWAAPLDKSTGKLLKEPLPVLAASEPSSVVAYDVSQEGTLVYWTTSGTVHQDLAWVDRDGNEVPLNIPLPSSLQPRISPDGKHIAIMASGHIWIYSLVHSTLERLTFGEQWHASPVWSPDRRVAFARYSNGAYNLFLKSADGAGSVERLTTSDKSHFPTFWSTDGEILLFFERNDSGGCNLAKLSMQGDLQTKLLHQSEYCDWQPVLSPDSRWLAYTSNQTGKNEVYVRAFPDVESGQWLISNDGGEQPLFSPDGTELYYWGSEGLMVVPVNAKTSFDRGKPRLLWRLAKPMSSIARYYDVDPDASRFLVARPNKTGESKLFVSLNWFDELERLVPTK